jgi:hypothetical protein
MARSQAGDVAATLASILAAANGTASVNLYMAAGGTNFGPWAGANVFPKVGDRQQAPEPAQGRLQQAALAQQRAALPGSSSSSSSRNGHELYQPHITSYDYNCPIGEAGTVGQLGMGGASKFDALRQVIAAAQGISVQQLPPLPSAVPLLAYGPVVFSEGLYLLDALPQLSASCRGSTYCSKQLGQGGSSSSSSSSSRTSSSQQERLHSAAASGDQEAASGRQRQAATLSALAWPRSSTLMLQRLPRVLADTQPFAAVHSQQQQQLGASQRTSSVEGNQELGGRNSSATAAAAAAAAPPAPVQSSSQYPLPMEQYGQYYGLMLYQTVLARQQAAPGGGRLHLTAHDTVWVFLDGQLLGRSFRSAPSSIEVPPSPFNSSSEARQGSGISSSGRSEKHTEHSVAADLSVSKRLLLQQNSSSGSSSGEGRLLQLLVWPLGRNNFGLFGSSMNDQKGLLGNVSLAGRVLTGWTVHHLCLEGGGPGAFTALQLPWRPLAPTAADAAAGGAGGAGMHWGSSGSASVGSEAAVDAVTAAAAAAATAASVEDSPGQPSSRQQPGIRPVLVLPGSSAWAAQHHAAKHKQQQQQQPSSAGVSSSGVGGIFAGAGNVTAFIATVAEAQAQAVIAAAADAASGNGPATAAARAAATIRAGMAADAAADDGNIDVVPHAKGPLLLRGMLHVPASSNSSQQQQQASLLPGGRPADTFLHLGEGWGRGQVWVNGHSLGSYWAEQGPQMSLYLPGSFLQAGPNEVVLLELDGRLPARQDRPLSIDCADVPDFDGPAAGPAPLA